ncbi:MAG TPA: hypothetical protein VJR92_10935 [Gemmatimonadaceae bacterium]|nr:hypothetical protein [Gemmatimonadaceae bacterium]
MCLSLAATFAACDNAGPAEVRDGAGDFEVRETWSAAVTPVGTATLQASVTVTEYFGSRMQAVVTVTGATPNAVYQWRMYRGGDCSVNVAATNSTAGNGLFLFATVPSYPDIVADATGAATITRSIAGSLDSLGAYSVRVRPSQSATNWNGLSPIACGDLERS